MNLFKKVKNYLIAPLIVLVICLLVFSLKGIYPFGTNTISSGDFGQSYVPFYYYLYDVFHGTKSIFFDYALGLGSNTYGGFVIDGLFNPFSWIVLLSSRNNIIYMLSFVMIAKLMFISFTSYLLFKEINKKEPFYNYLFAVIYALSSYCLIYNSNIMWLDIVGLFPLFILATRNLLLNNKIYYFSIILSLILIFNYNLAFMVLLFIIFIIPIYIHYGLEKNERKKAVFNLIMGVLLSIGLSSFAFIPSLIQTLTSYRFSGNFVNEVSNVYGCHKLLILFFYSLPLLFFIYANTHKQVNKKNMKMINISLVLTAIIPIFFERVNLMWHTGSYQLFPFRYGFIPVLLLYIGALEYFKDNKEKEKKKNNNILSIVITTIILVILSIILIYIAIYINSHNPVFNYTDPVVYFTIIISTIISIYIFNIIINNNNRKVSYLMIGIFTLISALCYTYGYLGISQYNQVENEHSDKPIFYSLKLSKIVKSDLYRLKNESMREFENGSLVSNIPDQRSFVHIIGKNQIFNNIQLGYSNNRTKLQGAGGTIFTDAILGTKYVISSNELNDDIYHKIGSIEKDNIYEYKNVLPFGVLYDEELKKIPDNKKAFDANNYLYRKLFNKNEDIIDIKNYSINKDEKARTFNIHIEGKKELYLYIDNYYFGDSPDYILLNKIKVNEKEIIIPTLNNDKNTKYPNAERNGIIDLGMFNDEDVTVSINIKNDKVNYEEKDIYFGLLDINKYLDLFNYSHDIKVSISNNKINVKGNVNHNTNIMLPIVYNDGFKSNVKIKEVYNTFIGLPLIKGKNDITITFYPKMFKESLIFTIITIILMIFCHFIKKIFDIRNVKIIMFIFWLFGIVIYVFAFYKVYLKSIIDTFL